MQPALAWWSSLKLMDKNATIFIAGCSGLVGSNIAARLSGEGFTHIIAPTSKRLDLTHQVAVMDYFKTHRPDYVFLCAAKVGGIYANSTYPAEFIYQNLAIETNIIHAAFTFSVKKLLFLGSSCIYPKHCPQPMREVDLLSGPLEPTNDAYAIAKIAGIKMCQAYNFQYGTNFIACMPTNLYGRNDNYDRLHAHVLPALIRKVHEAKEGKTPAFVVWGSGSPLREFLYAGDLAEACVFLMEHYQGSDIVNIGSGEEVSIAALAETICGVVGFDGDLVFDASKPDGTPRKLLDSSKINAMGWQPKVRLKDGIRIAYEDFLTGNVRM